MFLIESFEIASYNATTAAARELGFDDIANICETVITEEQEMADWPEMQLPMVVRQHLLSVEVNR